MTGNRATAEALSAMVQKGWEKLQAAKTDRDNEHLEKKTGFRFQPKAKK